MSRDWYTREVAWKGNHASNTKIWDHGKSLLIFKQYYKEKLKHDWMMHPFFNSISDKTDRQWRNWSQLIFTVPWRTTVLWSLKITTFRRNTVPIINLDKLYTYIVDNLPPPPPPPPVDKSSFAWWRYRKALIGTKFIDFFLSLSLC